MKASFNYYIAKKSFKKKKEAEERGEIWTDDDYVHTKEELRHLRNLMDDSMDSLKAERKSNQQLLPDDPTGNNLDVIREQILDLNDKFDYLVSLFLKSKNISFET